MKLLSRDQMSQHGRALADSHKVTEKAHPEMLLSRLKANEKVLAETCSLLVLAVKANHRLAPAGEWLLDNFYLIKEQIQTAKKHLPRGYSRELPCLISGVSAGFPRVYDIALETISCCDGRVDQKNLITFITAYQQVNALNLNELWAIPIMLRLALIENLCRVGARVAADRTDRNLADLWASKMSATAEKDPKSLITLIADMARSRPTLSRSFVAELARRLQGKGPGLAMTLTWVEQSLFESGMTIEQMVQSEIQQQAADQVSISNSIGSLRLLGAIDWQEFVEARSFVEKILRDDPPGVYSKMDFSTRDRYRHVVEKIARNSPLSEEEIARIAIRLAADSAYSNGNDDRSAHVGFYLIDKGLPQLEHLGKMRLSIAEKLLRMTSQHSLFLYLGTIMLVSTVLTGYLLQKVYSDGINGLLFAFIGSLLFICVNQLALSLVNWMATLLVKPNPLPRMDFSTGIPAEFRTLVVIPTMLTGAQSLTRLVEALEVRFLANRDENISFCLLTDFADATQENVPGDELLVQMAVKKIEELNEKYPGAKHSFYLFHRPRQWNAEENIWMGYERKRGKLADLNSLLRGASKGRFSVIVGNIAFLQTVRYVITLDTDTGLPRESAWKMVSTMAHPLNHPLYDKKLQRISEGYGILQPRVALSMSGSNRSWYARLYGSDPGVDPYTRVVSDIYQDLFSEGSFNGKGIYDVDAFELTLNGRFPENKILSHDLVEGCYVRSGLLSDVLIYEEYPSRYSSDVNRRYRWIRGDWQISHWLLPNVPLLSGASEINPLSRLSRWKIFDNLRRSVVPLAFTLLFLISWIKLSPAWFWTLSVVGMLLVQSMIASVLEMYRKPLDVMLGQHLFASARSAGRNFVQAIFNLTSLPYEAYFSVDAVIRTTWRLLVSQKGLLEWNPSGNEENYTGLAGSYRTMWFAPFVAFAAIITLSFSRPASLLYAWPILLLWIVSPAISWWFSRSFVISEDKLCKDHTIFLRMISRKTWAFFETFVGPESNWLPPDNYQENRPVPVAYRSSPTNMGISLLANLSAYDFGYIQSGQLLERTANSITSMQVLERYKGHFFNWYDIKSLKPLQPLYISSVDSGNLAAHLLTLRSGLLALSDNKIVSPRLFEGLNDTLMLFMEAAGKETSASAKGLQDSLALAIASPPNTLSKLWVSLEKIVKISADMADGLSADTYAEGNWWASELVHQCRNAMAELVLFVPWIALPFNSGKFIDFKSINEIPTLSRLATLELDVLPAASNEKAASAGSEEIASYEKLRGLIVESCRCARERIAVIESLSRQLNNLADMEYDFLYDKARHLLAIGYNVTEERRDSSFYDLLASEARLATFVAIAQGKLHQESWFALGRILTNTGGDPVLLSWDGSMFEYLMPLLIMPTYENTLLDQTYKGVVEMQIEYGKRFGIPWGISESGYNMVDVHLNYQYRAFGVPDLGLKRLITEELVVAPYATALALMVSPEAACQNLKTLVDQGYSGKFGLFESIDFTPSRQTRGKSGTVVKSYMAHHQGMVLLALGYSLLNRPMQKRFESDPIFQATTLLLQERVPKTMAFYSHPADFSELRTAANLLETPVRVFNGMDTQIPQIQLLSNRRYHVMVTNSGGGYSRWKDIAVTRWREDATCDNWGTFCYIRDMENGEYWSNTCQPSLKQPKFYEVIFSEGRAEFRRRDNDIEMHTEIAVSPEDDIELRRMILTNRSRRQRKIEITSYAEVVLSPPASDDSHTTFSNLFVQTEIHRQRKAILCSRRPRSKNDPVPWMFHLLAVHRAQTGEISFETDRMKFIGRGNSISAPQAMKNSNSLSGSEGSVLDPVVSIRYCITLEPGKSATIDLVTGVAESRDKVLNLTEKYQDRRLADRVFDLAWTHSQVILQQLNITEADAQLYGHLAGSVIYANPSLRADAGILIRNKRSQSGLWGYSISGDLPIVLLQIKDLTNIKLVRQLVQAHAYWRLKGLTMDLVIWNEDHAGYRQILHDQIMGLIAAGIEVNVTGRSGGIFVRLAEQISSEDRILFQSIARAIISDSRGTLAEQLRQRGIAEVTLPNLKPSRKRYHDSNAASVLPRRDLKFFNGVGGFTGDGKEYVITTTHENVTPAPWVNVLANSDFGTIVSESGNSYTWSENAHELRLTPWSDDPVGNSSGEVFYLRDEERGNFWSPMPLPKNGSTPYVTRHGFGYTVFEHTEAGIRSEVWVYVALEASVKFTVIKIKNESGEKRRLSATGYVEWVLGDLRPKSAMHIITRIDPTTGALFAQNSYSNEYSGRIGFFDVDDASKSVSGDRVEFIGRNGTLRNPAALKRTRLSNKVGPALDPCAAIQVYFDLSDGQEREIIFRLGAGKDVDNAIDLVKMFRGSLAARSQLEAIWRFWNHTHGAIQIETPDSAVNIMANGWLVYQTLACRLWARSGYYQSGGAFGFRDQLQDTMALIHTQPGLLREHLLLCAAHQFKEGDVQHWWHPQAGRGVRTHCSDDMLWLVMAACRYVLSTGDRGILKESVYYIEGRPVNPDEDSYFDLPIRSQVNASFYDHCVAAIEKALNFGIHGLPLIGSGDWNDGMNLVGENGKGESVWLAFFLYDVLMQFSELARINSDLPYAERCVKSASILRENIEMNAWDGEWYRRAYFDDGTPLGSASNSECSIDSIAQSWSVLSKAVDTKRSRMAMESVDKKLIDREHSIIRLFDPPFDKSDLNPGYIKGYVPGVRENGGQYTHGAIWTTMAFAALGESSRAWELFRIINPINHAKSPEDIDIYKVEPYVVAADVYALYPHHGRGGWTWYTGSAGWMYRLIVESLLGIRLEVDKISFAPCLPEKGWDKFKVHYRYRETVYHITFLQKHESSGEMIVEVDGILQPEKTISLVDDHREHRAEVKM
ncbi:MAG: cyclic beta 1-2 glucan synthetase [Candidatus Riflebacteria bacterium]|nr:cyclic beta 1-2 glucan synthetase [Candidatus Riflebacteria bacterium]